MCLQHLVDYFNDRFEHEDSSHRPFIQQEGLVSGRFGAVRISSVFSPVRQLGNHQSQVGHIAKIAVMDTQFLPIRVIETEQALTDAIHNPVDFMAVVNLDRLCRIVHILNYLAISRPHDCLFLDVDPRHILGVEGNHGVYFEEVILKCGLATQNVVISMVVNDFYAPYFPQIRYGLENYRRRGYPIALNIGLRYGTKNLPELIADLAPDYLRVNAPDERYTDNLIGLNLLKSFAGSTGGQILLQHITRQAQCRLAGQMGLNLVQGEYFDQLSADALRCA